MTQDLPLTIVVAMAGAGSRFSSAGYQVPKPFVEVCGRRMVELVVQNLSPTLESRFVLIAQRAHVEEYDLDSIVRSATECDYQIVPVEGLTEGAACTVLLAESTFQPEGDLLIVNADQFLTYDINTFIAEARSGEKDGLIMTFWADHPKWSYARTDESGRVVETAEKVVISNNATTGFYYFRRSQDFVRAARRMIESDTRFNNEFYICPVYNEMITEEKAIYISEIQEEEMHNLGTPEDLKIFETKVAAGEINLP